MARSEAEVLRLLNDVYAAGLGEHRWTDALESIAGFFDAAGAVAFDLDRGAGTVAAMHAFGVGATQDDYAQRMNAINPRMKRALLQPGCHTSFDYEALPEAAIRRHEFYDWLTRECGVKYFIGSRMLDAGEVSSFVSVEFTAKQGHADPHFIELFSLVSQHFANAWLIARRQAQTERIQDFNVLLLENTPWGVVALDHRGCVLSVNGAAQRAIGRSDGFAISSQRLRALRAAEDRSLQAEIGRSLQSACGESVHAGATLAVGRRDSAFPYGLRILPLRHMVGRRQHGVPFVVILIADPVEPRLPSRDDVMALCGLTAREAELALCLAKGVSLGEAARRLRISRNTARVHLANAMRKTCTHRQAALIGLIPEKQAVQEELARR
jgi:DNA-binding CsgD family transcriptional regulator/PAS domain-containing protein